MQLKQFLQSAFDKQDFMKFITERFYGFAPNLHENEYLGKVRLDDRNEIGFFIFEVKENKDIENSRVGFHKELKIYADKHMLDGAIGAFYNRTQQVWRLSFIRFSYDETHKKETTSQKRFTFLLGNEKIKTANEQLKNLKYPKISELEKAFSVESVTKEFYKGLVKEYEKLLNEYLTYPTNSDNDKKEFAIRLIGRILFIKFLNKKALIPDDIFFTCPDYYHEKLEPLFFEQLNTQKSERKKEFANDSIPFLNGGLFEPLHLDYYEYSGVSSKYINMLKVDDNFFTELYEHLDQFNFTIDENSIEDSDLSIDPEMLGRIFENLLAEINPETSQNARKSTGSYYTPREIVEYMVNSSLLEYIKTKTDMDEEVLKTIIFKNQEPLHDYDKTKILSAIFELKILDPACGSGAFPMGLLQRIVKILELIDEDATIWFNLQSKEFREAHKNRNKNYIRKLSIIKNTIYGIDIQPIAIEISKLRFFLSLIVDEDGEPEPLPNLEFKFVCANSLLAKPKNNQLATLEYFMLEGDLLKLKNEYFEASGERKREIKKEYKQTQKEMFDEQEAINLFSALDNKLTNYDPFDPVSVAGFFDSDFMFNIKDGFDIVIGNPPYIVYEANMKEEISNFLKFEIFQKCKGGKLNAYELFLAKTDEILKDNGVSCQIFQNSFLADNSAKGIRKHFVSNTRIVSVDSFPERDDPKKRVFESVKMSVCILLSQKIKLDDYSISVNFHKDRTLNNFNNVIYSKTEIIRLNEDSQVIPSLLEKEKGVFISYYAHSYKYSDFFDCIEGELNMTFHKNYMNSDNKNPKIIKGAQVQRYFITDTPSQGKIEYVDAIKYMKDYYKSKKSIHHKQKRIALQGITGANDSIRIVSTLMDKNLFCANSCNYIIARPENNIISLEVLLCILNSKITNWIFRKTSTNSNVNCYEINNLILPNKIKEEDTKPFEILVDYVMFLKQQDNKEYMTDFFERVIDIVVYELYFQDELHKYNYGILEILKNESFEFDNSLDTIEVVYKKWSDKNHKIAYNVHFIDSLDIIKVIEGKK